MVQPPVQPPSAKPSSLPPKRSRGKLLVLFLLFTLALAAALVIVARVESTRRERILVKPTPAPVAPPVTQKPAEVAVPSAPASATEGPSTVVLPPSPANNPVAERTLALLREANASILANNAAKAEELAVQAKALSPSDAEPRFMLGHAYLLQGRYADAIPELEAALRLAPLRPQGLLDLSLGYYLAGNAPEALELVETLIRVHPGFAPAPMQRALILLALPDRQEDALAAFEAVLAVQPDNAGVHSNYALVLSRAGRHDEALAQIDAAIALAPAQPSFRQNRAIFCAKAGRMDEALEALKAALTLASARQRDDILADPDLAPLRDAPGYAEVVHGFDSADVMPFPAGPSQEQPAVSPVP